VITGETKGAGGLYVLSSWTRRREHPGHIYIATMRQASSNHLRSHNNFIPIHDNMCLSFSHNRKRDQKEGNINAFELKIIFLFFL